MVQSEREYAVLVPVKPPAHGKSRMRGVTDAVRRELATAFALDTIAACVASRRVARVLVVTDDAAFALRCAESGAVALPDGAGSGLNATLVQAAQEAHRRWPELTPVALCADLPALRSTELDEALAAVADDDAWFVADADGTGTTAYLARVAGFSPQFGVDSAAAHAATGALPLRGDWPTLRRDVDDLIDLEVARPMGLGAHTRTVVQTHLDPPAHG